MTRKCDSQKRQGGRHGAAEDSTNHESVLGEVIVMSDAEGSNIGPSPCGVGVSTGGRTASDGRTFNCQRGIARV